MSLVDGLEGDPYHQQSQCEAETIVETTAGADDLQTAMDQGMVAQHGRLRHPTLACQFFLDLNIIHIMRYRSHNPAGHSHQLADLSSGLYPLPLH